MLIIFLILFFKRKSPSNLGSSVWTDKGDEDGGGGDR